MIKEITNLFRLKSENEAIRDNQILEIFLNVKMK